MQAELLPHGNKYGSRSSQNACEQQQHLEQIKKKKMLRGNLSILKKDLDMHPTIAYVSTLFES